MSEQGAKKYLFILNPVAGGKNKQNWESAIRDYFRSSNHTAEIFILTGQEDETSLRHWIGNVRPDYLVAVGGDGTVSMAAHAVQQTDICLGILPAGSANGMAKELELPLDMVGALKVLTDGVAKKIDLIEVNGKHLCLHLSDIGMNAQLIHYFEEGGIRGKWGYARMVFKVLRRKESLEVTINTGKESFRRKAFMVVLANARKYGTGAIINPEGNLSDGLFEVIIIRRLALSEIIKAIITHKTFNPQKFELIQASSVSISTKHRTHFQVDGEYLGKTTQVDAKILPSRLLIQVPADSL